MKRITAIFRRPLPAAASSGFRAALQTVAVNIFIVGINFGTGFVTARLLGPEGRGELTTILIWPQLLAHMLTLGLPGGLLYGLRRWREERSEILAAALLLGTAVGVVACGVGVALLPVLLGGQEPGVVASARWAMIAAVPALVGLLIAAGFQALHHFRAFNLLRYGIPLITLGALVAVLAAGGVLTPRLAALAYLAPPFVLLPVLGARLLRQIPFRWPGSLRPFRRLLGYGLRSYGNDVVSTVAVYSDRLVVLAVLDAASLGLYAVALGFSKVIGVFQEAVASVLFPKAAGLETDGVMEMMTRAARLSSAVAGLAAAVLALLGPWLLVLFYGEAFRPASATFRILAVEAVVSGAAVVLAQGFNALDRPELISLRQLLSLILVAPLMLLLGGLWGIVGVAAALLLGGVFRLVFTMIAYPRSLGVPAPGLLPRSGDVAYLRERLRSGLVGE